MVGFCSINKSTFRLLYIVVQSIFKNPFHLPTQPNSTQLNSTLYIDCAISSIKAHQLYRSSMCNQVRYVSQFDML